MPAAGRLLDSVRDVPGAALLEPPHVSLGYPWLSAEQALAGVGVVRAVAAAVPAFDARLTGPYRFGPDPRGRVLVHARPDDEDPFRLLAGALGADLRDVHLSIARVVRGGDVGAVEGALAGLLPRRVRVAVLQLTVREQGRWRPVLEAPLGQPG